ncbi:hypothetical protein AU467_06490 [Mesorhizobium loti]|uniref:VTT domain-containing protein n=1 Tax=Rhizobium loti TaxID=381 RepID=A0A117N2Q9_RHILI|nr:hypothetical protein AU467_06490 [Mesorhizobium loti]
MLEARTAEAMFLDACRGSPNGRWHSRMSLHSSYILDLLSAHPYAALLPLAIAEGPLVTIAGGVLVATGQLKFWSVFATVVAGDLAGDSALYALGRWGGTPMIKRWARQSAITQAAALQDLVLRKADRVLVTGKLTHAIGAPVLIAAGIVRMTFGRFLAVNFLATLPKSLVLLCIGLVFHSWYADIEQHIDYLYIILLSVGAIALYFLMSR